MRVDTYALNAVLLYKGDDFSRTDIDGLTAKP